MDLFTANYIDWARQNQAGMITDSYGHNGSNTEKAGHFQVYKEMGLGNKEHIRDILHLVSQNKYVYAS